MNQNIESTMEEAGCPYFFDTKCHEEIYDDKFQTYCLDNFEQCDTYKLIERKNKS